MKGSPVIDPEITCHSRKDTKSDSSTPGTRPRTHQATHSSATMARNCRFESPTDFMTANSRRRRMRLLVTVLNTLAMAMSARITANSRQNTFTTVAIIWLESRCSM